MRPGGPGTQRGALQRQGGVPRGALAGYIQARWEAHVAVIGAGYVGLEFVLELADEFPQLELSLEPTVVEVFDAQQLRACQAKSDSPTAANADLEESDGQELQPLPLLPYGVVVLVPTEKHWMRPATEVCYCDANWLNRALKMDEVLYKNDGDEEV